jgi:hypothetical protein
MKTTLSKRVTACFAIAVLFSPASVFAATTTFGVDVGVGQTDNISRVAVDKTDETIVSAGLDFSVEQNSRRLYANAAAQLAYLDYLNNTYDHELVGNVGALANLRLIPDGFEWLFQDNFGQVASDPVAPVTPANRENINYFTTGPDVIVPIGSLNKFRLSGRFSQVLYQKSTTDNDRYSGSVAFLHELSPASVLSLNGTWERIKYDQFPDSDYDKQEAYGRYELNGMRTTLAIDFGYSTLDQTTTSSGGYLVRIDLARKLTPSTTLTLTGGREFSDAADSFLQLQQSGDINLGTQPANPTSSPLSVSMALSVGISLASVLDSAPPFRYTTKTTDKIHRKIAASNSATCFFRAS